MTDTINIALTFNDKYYRYAYVTIFSILQNNDDVVDFYLLQSDVSALHKKEMQKLVDGKISKIHWIEVDADKIPALCPTNIQWSIEIYYRLLLAELLEESVERILYLDVDIIVNRSLRDFYDMDFEGMDMIGCLDAAEYPFGDFRDIILNEFEDKSYISSGVILFNLAQIRKRYSFYDYIKIAEKFNYNIIAPDQDLINYVHHGKIKLVPSEFYNMFAKLYYNNGYDYQKTKDTAVIVHFIGWKPWDGEGVHYDIEKLWWDYAKQTPYYISFLEEFMTSAIASSMVYDTMKQQMDEKQELLETLQKSQQLCQKLYDMVVTDKW